MDLRTWRKLINGKSGNISRNKMGHAVINTLVAALQTGITLASRYWENRVGLLERELLDEEAPVFIIGHWRSGTTLLHELLDCHEQLKAPTTYQCFCPQHFLLSERVIKGLFPWVLPLSRGFDSVRLNWDSPQEDEFALLTMGAPSPYRRIAFPSAGNQIDGLDILSLRKEEQEQWSEALLGFVRRLMFNDKRKLVLKSPSHTARISTILRLFPKARFIFISRDPFQMIPSAIKMWKYMDYYHGLSTSLTIDYARYVIEVFKKVETIYLKQKEMLTEENLVEIRYEDLVKDPEGTLKIVTRSLGLNEFETDLARLKVTLSGMETYAQDRYILRPGDEEMIAKATIEYCKRYGYS